MQSLAPYRYSCCGRGPFTSDMWKTERTIQEHTNCLKGCYWISLYYMVPYATAQVHLADYSIATTSLAKKRQWELIITGGCKEAAPLCKMYVATNISFKSPLSPLPSLSERALANCLADPLLCGLQTLTWLLKGRHSCGQGSRETVTENQQLPRKRFSLFMVTDNDHTEGVPLGKRCVGNDRAVHSSLTTEELCAWLQSPASLSIPVPQGSGAPGLPFVVAVLVLIKINKDYYKSRSRERKANQQGQ